ncbi:SLC13 family permease [Chakrabartyella piscis]|uniref:SLC13 family permease n=1 Tax=Chakrabartyella piscis TaxID=2918914 RepID=UPI002958B333|nr:SLC13 family permease [Chakrabartyella piscis]
MSMQKRYTYIVIGPILYLLVAFGLADVMTEVGAKAIGVSVWMIFWWITRPVHISITGIVPVVANAFLSIIPMSTLIANYSSESIILVFGSGLLTLPWAVTGLDKRIALKVLSVVGPSMKSQIAVWLTASVALSTVLPNVAVCALFTPIAVSMLKAAGYDDIQSCAASVPILLAVGWGVSLGGAGTPLGGAMNVTAISFLEEYTGQEFMYVDWIVRIIPYLIIATIVLMIGMWMMPTGVKSLEGTKEFFKDSYAELGEMKRDEKICLGLFVAALAAAFARPFYTDLLPGLAPAYAFVTLGFISFFITSSNNGFLLTWDETQKGMMWGMMILFASGLAMGSMLNGSGASARLGELVATLPLDGGLTTVLIVVIAARVISELTNGTTAAAVCCPIVFSFAAEMGLNPVPYWFITVMSLNAEFLLPLSVRAIPVAYGLDANKMMKYGIPMTIINMVVVTLFGFLAITFWPAYGILS